MNRGTSDSDALRQRFMRIADDLERELMRLESGGDHLPNLIHMGEDAADLMELARQYGACVHRYGGSGADLIQQATAFRKRVAKAQRHHGENG
jgi:hypothetical protein